MTKKYHFLLTFGVSAPFGGYSHLTHSCTPTTIIEADSADFGESCIITANFALQMRVLSGDTLKLAQLQRLLYTWCMQFGLLHHWNINSGARFWPFMQPRSSFNLAQLGWKFLRVINIQPDSAVEL
jgi:hypothetical protein